MTTPTSNILPACHLLFVDDEPRVLGAIQRVLRSSAMNCRLSFACSVDEALAVVETGGVDVIISDFNMPGRDGFDLIRSITTSEQWRHIPVLILTGNAESDLKRRALEAGAFDLVAKPVSREDLVARISSVLRTKRYADQLASLNSTLERQVVGRTLELEQSRTDILLCLAMAGECRDTDTGRHLVRVAHYSRLIAVAMGLPSDDTRRIFKASPLHDIGKLGVPDSVLLKPGPLTDSERKLMQKHCETGHRILTAHKALRNALCEQEQASDSPDNPLLDAAAVIALNHHEKWDGSGYPGGLRGGAIPEYARIVAVADVYDALTTVRPYKAAIPHDAAVKMILQSAGSHFEPAMTRVFEQHSDAIDGVRRQWIDVSARAATAERLMLRGLAPLLDEA